MAQQSGMDPGEYESLVAKAAGGGAAAGIELLAAMKTHKIHQPDLIVLHGGRLLKGSTSKLGSEVWTVYEQVFMAAVDLGAKDWRDYCLAKLVKQFPSSNRVERLRGICEESKENYAEAQRIYEKLVQEKPEDTLTRKRQIAMLKAQGKIDECIKEINKYLELFCTDSEVWHELAELYIENGSLSRALFCFEELVVSNPRSMYHVLTYAELLYSTGDFELSRKYYSLACYLDGENLRALWGLAAVNMVMAEKDKQSGAEKLTQLSTFGLQKLKTRYSGLGNASHAKAATSLLDDMLK